MNNSSSASNKRISAKEDKDRHNDEEYDKIKAHAAEVKKISDLRENQAIYEKIASTFRNRNDQRQRSVVTETETETKTDSGIDPVRDLDPHIPDRDYAEYYIKTVKKTVRREDSFVRQVFYTAISKDSDDPLNLAVLAKTSAGKTYVITETLKYFNDKNIWFLGSMTPKVLVRQNGILVDADYQPLKPQIKELKRAIEEAKEKKDRNQVERLEDELESLLENAKVLIELQGICLVFLEPPHPQTWNIIKSTLSHDRYEIEHPYVYEDQKLGFKVKKIVTRGWPSCIFASARDESQWKIWPEIQSRFLVISPNITPEKVQEGNILISQRKSLPRRIKEMVIVSSKEAELATKCATYLTQHIKNTMVQKPELQKDPFWIPYGLILGLALPSEKGTDNRVAARIFSFLRMVALVRSRLRNRLEYFGENQIIPSIMDLHETFHIMQNVSGIPDYKLAMFKDYYWPCYLSKYDQKQGEPDIGKNGKQELVFGLTNKEFCEYYKEKTGKILQTRIFRETYIDEWYNNGLIESVPSVINANQSVNYPILMEPQKATDADNIIDDNHKVPYNLQSVFKIGVIGDSAQSPLFLQPRPIVVQKNFNEIPENWLELQFLGFLQLTVQGGIVSGELSTLSDVFDHCTIYDVNNSKMCICQFLDKYPNTYSLNSYFQNGISHKNFKKNTTLIRNTEQHDTKDCRIIGDWLKSPLTPIINTNSGEPMPLRCYYCAKNGNGKVFETYDEGEYLRHGALRHYNKPMYPNGATMKKYNLIPQGKPWEK